MSTVNKYRLFSEWREISAWGPTLEDAVMLRGHLQESDTFSRDAGHQKTMGEDHKIVGAKPGTVVVREHVVPNSRRGDKEYVRVVLRDVQGKYLELHATIEETLDCA
jgi:hypothetical protein